MVQDYDSPWNEGMAKYLPSLIVASERPADSTTLKKYWPQSSPRANSLSR